MAGRKRDQRVAGSRDAEIQTGEIMTETKEETPVPKPEPKPLDVNDVDASWDGTGSLDAHREQAFAKLKQPGFGAARLVKDGE